MLHVEQVFSQLYQLRLEVFRLVLQGAGVDAVHGRVDGEDLVVQLILVVVRHAFEHRAFDFLPEFLEDRLPLEAALE